MNKLLSALCLLSLAVTTTQAQTKKSSAPAEKKSSTAAAEKSQYKAPAIATEGGFQVSPNGLEYKIVSRGTGTRKPVPGDFISLHMMQYIDDSMLFSTRQIMNNQPAEIQMQQFTKGDVAEGFAFMNEGDSAIFRLAVDSLVKLPNFQMPPFMKAGVGQKIIFYTKLVSVKSQAEKQAEMAAASEKQKTTDDMILQAHFKEKNIKPTKTASGLYYTITKQGTGATAKQGDTVVVNYTGKFLDGEAFDSNMDPKFQHVQPFSFMVGMSQVIPGWDEAFMLFKEGTKGTIYIPSGLAYGARAQGPIKENSILMFDIELVDVKNNVNTKK